MELVKPDIGLLFWMTTCFVLLLILMKRYAWGPILRALNEREQEIQRALDQAEEAKKQIEEATSQASQILEEGKREKEAIIKAAQVKLSEYKREQQNKINAQIDLQLASAKEDILQQKRAAVGELKNIVAELSVEIAQKILKKEFANEDQHKSLIKESIENLEMD